MLESTLIRKVKIAFESNYLPNFQKILRSLPPSLYVQVLNTPHGVNTLLFKATFEGNFRFAEAILVNAPDDEARYDLLNARRKDLNNSNIIHICAKDARILKIEKLLNTISNVLLRKKLLNETQGRDKTVLLLAKENELKDNVDFLLKTNEAIDQKYRLDATPYVHQSLDPIMSDPVISIIISKLSLQVDTPKYQSLDLKLK